VALTPNGAHRIIGKAPAPNLTRTTVGPIFQLVGVVDLSLEHLVLSGATGDSGTPEQVGHAIYCQHGGGTPILALDRVTIRDNAQSAIRANNCLVTATRSAFTNNAGIAVEIIDGTGTFDSCLVAENAGGMSLDSGIFSVTNSFIVRNFSPTGFAFGIDLFSTGSGHRIEFNTIADNTDSIVGPSGGFGFGCNLQGGATAVFPNNIIVRNKQQIYGGACTFPNSIIADSDIAPLAFVSPDSPPYDYRIGAGSIAIDAATISTITHDFDGDPRPSGAGFDVGADEYVP
jgi:hypothetical protein